MNGSARRDRGTRQAARIAQRMQVAAAVVQHGAEIAVGAGHLPHLLAVQQLHRHAAADALLGGAFDSRRACFIVGRAQRAVLPCLAGDLVAADQVEREVGSTVGKRDHAAAEVGAEIGLDLIGIVLQPRIDLPAIIARCAPARLLRFQHGHVDALLGQMQRRGQPGEAAADDRDRDASCPHRAAASVSARPPYRRRGLAAAATRQVSSWTRPKFRADAARAAKSPACAHAVAG